MFKSHAVFVLELGLLVLVTCSLHIYISYEIQIAKRVPTKNFWPIKEESSLIEKTSEKSMRLR